MGVTIVLVATVLVACGMSEPTDVASPAVTAGPSGSRAGAGAGAMTGAGVIGGAPGAPAVGAGSAGSPAAGVAEGASGAPAASAGSAAAPAAGSGGAGGPGGSAPGFTELYNTSLSSCKNVICHGGVTDGPGVGLNMQTRDDAYKTLVGIMASDNGDCAGSGLMRVVPSDPDASLLIMKIARQPPCGGQMPPGGSLIAEQIDPVRAWIAAGAPDN